MRGTEKETFESVCGRKKGQMPREKAKTQRRMVLDLDTRWRRGEEVRLGRFQNVPRGLRLLAGPATQGFLPAIKRDPALPRNLTGGDQQLTLSLGQSPPSLFSF